jgi:hypothetical protein
MIRSQCLPVPATGGTRLTLFKRRFIALCWFLPRLFRGSGAEKTIMDWLDSLQWPAMGATVVAAWLRGIAVQAAAQLGLLVAYLEQLPVGGVGLA